MIAAQVKMASADEGWMLLDHGKRMTIVNSTTAVPSFDYTLLHFQHGAWTEVPLAFAEPSTQMWNLDAREAGAVWLAGDDIASGAAVVAHYANGAWTRWTGASIGEDAGQLMSVSEVSPSDAERRRATPSDAERRRATRGWVERPVPLRRHILVESEHRGYRRDRRLISARAREQHDESH